MKKTMVISFIAAAMLLILCTACHVAESHNEVLAQENTVNGGYTITCLLYTSPSPRDMRRSRMPSSA